MNTRTQVAWIVAAVAVAFGSTSVKAQTSSIAPLAGPPTMIDPAVIPASGPGGCASCSSASNGFVSPGVYGYGKYSPPACDVGCGSEGCGENGCYPGRPPCETCEGQCRLGRIFCAWHNALCCPDPCYEPHWVCAANAALFVDGAQPVTQSRFRWDAGRNVTQPDRSEYFWAAIGSKGRPNPETRVNYNELSFYQEVATERFSFYIMQPYRSMDAAVNGGSGGFGDLTLGTKTLFLDSEVLHATFQFQTQIPTGSAGSGAGVGHVSLTPSILTSIKLYPDTYFQTQLGYWIPISPTQVNGSSFAGSVFQFNLALNHVLCRPLRDTALIGTIESVGYTFTSGKFTDANGNVFPANNQTYFGVGPGFRLCICDKADIGFGAMFSVTSNHFADQLYRTELRWRY